jgi:threonylcarbamoyladenosine tRNA methylthiotransferase MtaB
MKVFLDTVGCRLNQSEIETIANQFRAAGHQVVGEVGDADLVVVNTCAVTAKAAADSRQKIRHISRSGPAKIAITGCWTTLNPDEAGKLPHVDWVVPNQQKGDLTAKILGFPANVFDLEPLARQPLPGIHRRTRAFIKAQDGCDNHCTFCITRLARGASQSRELAEVLSDIQLALRGGVQEVVITGVQLGAWGRDIYGESRLPELIKGILEQTEVKRVRLSSLEPWEVDASLLTLWQDPRMCRHLHLPLQSGSIDTLSRMARKTAPDDYRQLLQMIRSFVPEMAVTTDVIVGFPGETEKAFADSLEFIQQQAFSGGHVFTYSARQGTPAAKYAGQVPFAVRKERNTRVRSVFDAASTNYQQQFLDQCLFVLWESVVKLSPQGWTLAGWTDNYIRVEVSADAPLWNKISQVYLVDLTEDGMRGEILAGSNP